MATMRLFNPARERYQNSYGYQSPYAKPGYDYGLGQNPGQHYSESQIQNLSSVIAPPPPTHASSTMMQQSSYFNVNSNSGSPGFTGFPVKPVEHHSSSQAYSQQGSYGMGQQGVFGSAQHSSYNMRKQDVGLTPHVPYDLGKQDAYSSVQHGSYGSSHNGPLGSVQHGSYGLSQKRYSSGGHGAYGLANQGLFGLKQQSSFGSVAHGPQTMRRRQKSSYFRRSNTGFRSGEGSESEEEEEESEDEHS